MATILELENDGDSIKMWVGNTINLRDDLIVTVEAEYDPGQPFKFASRFDPIGQPEYPATLEITACYIELGKIDGEEAETKKFTLDAEQRGDIETAFFEYKEKYRGEI